MDFNEFQAIVQANQRKAQSGVFRNFTTEGRIDSSRFLYEWQGGFCGVRYDSNQAPPWYVSNGRGTAGKGNTYQEADEQERTAYDASFE